jgi:hypothetical protein
MWPGAHQAHPPMNALSMFKRVAKTKFVGVVLRLSKPWRALCIALAGIVLGAVAARFGNGLHPAALKDIPTVGRIQVLLPPVQALSLEGIHSFTVELKEVDDFARVYLNNYLIAVREIRAVDIVDAGQLPKPDPHLFESSVTPRGNFGTGPTEVKQFLRVGRNYLVAELENGAWGPCSARLEVKINGIAPLGFPVFLGEGFAAEGGVTLNPEIKVKVPKGDWLADAVCARRIYQIDLH